MKVHYLNYSNRRFYSQRSIANASAVLFGSFDTITSCDPSVIDPSFASTFSHILSQSRGAGLWLWKPYVILKTLRKISDGDYLFYSDSGVFFYSSIYPIISTLISLNQDIGCFELPLIERQWTKPDVLHRFQIQTQIPLGDTNQIMSSFHLIKKSAFSVNFYELFLSFCCNIHNLDDSSSTVHTCDDFIDHRHDQSILSLLYKSNNLIPLKDPTQFGVFPFAYGSSSQRCFKYGNIYNLGTSHISDVCQDKIKNFNLLLRVNRNCGNYGYIIHHSRSTNQFYSLIRFWLLRFFLYLGLYGGVLK